MVVIELFLLVVPFERFALVLVRRIVALVRRIVALVLLRRMTLNF